MAIIGLIVGYLIIVLVAVVAIIFALIVFSAGAASQDYSYEDDYDWDIVTETIEVHDSQPSSPDAPVVEESLPEGDQ